MSKAAITSVDLRSHPFDGVTLTFSVHLADTSAPDGQPISMSDLFMMLGLALGTDEAEKEAS